MGKTNLEYLIQYEINDYFIRPNSKSIIDAKKEIQENIGV